MVAKKTAVQQSASSGSTRAGGSGRAASGGAAGDADGGKTAKGVEGGVGAKKAAAGTAARKAAAAPRAGGATKKAASRAGRTEAVADGAAAPQTAGTRKAAAGQGTGKGTAGKTAGRTGSRTVDAGRAAGERPATRSRAKKAGAAQAAEQTGATTVVAKKTPGTATAAKTAVPKARIAAADPGDLAVRPGEDPWTTQEVEGARAELQAEETRLRDEITSSERALAGLMRDSGDGAGDDQADTGAKNITREHELALAANAREMLTQTEHALERLDAGTYGLCENCGDPIGKARMQAFPRATLCVECKQKQERRY
ncbi:MULTISPECIES: TraR/DksA family transcriptional regulator [unclassified Streptomyces]|uniref:TraR/DksA family transcriptional regulator n=1 Tax=unclassified Streptomyces TaxID=2593676 RepID=UPI00074882E3|nr:MULTISPECIES: TraR/DksA family transcriptional regulator [unclassified Streptomyces]KUL67811.1 DNA-binding protein [Streptomyces sp. NRRL WC-3604]KUL79319.1 DNA-binding protein [Streptomyces sp. NRRL WC-3605]